MDERKKFEDEESILDLTREADDASLGAELLDEVYATDDGFWGSDGESVSPPPPPRTSSRSSPVTSADGDMPQAVGANPRDRIVILGRRRAGKTIFLSRLYHRLYHPDRYAKEDSSMRMFATQGVMHRNLMSAIDSLDKGEWPPATDTNVPYIIDVTYKEFKLPLVAVEYGGELFTRAFVEEDKSPEAEMLREHVDRAMAVIILMDPEVIVKGTTNDIVDDDYGMVRAIMRIRESTGGMTVPIALSLTKWDERKAMVNAAGGLSKFVEKWYGNLQREAKQLHVMTCAAVQTQKDARGKLVPSLSKPPIGVVEPLEWCFEKLAKGARVRKEKRRLRRKAREQEARAIAQAAEKRIHDERRRNLKVAALIAVASVVVGAGLIIVFTIA